MRSGGKGGVNIFIKKKVELGRPRLPLVGRRRRGVRARNLSVRRVRNVALVHRRVYVRVRMYVRVCLVRVCVRTRVGTRTRFSRSASFDARGKRDAEWPVIRSPIRPRRASLLCGRRSLSAGPCPIHRGPKKAKITRVRVKNLRSLAPGLGQRRIRCRGRICAAHHRKPTGRLTIAIGGCRRVRGSLQSYRDCT